MLKNTSSAINQTEWQRVGWWSAVTLILASLPIYVGYLIADETHIFIGTVHRTQDIISYFSKIQQGFNGSWAFYLPYTSEPHPAIPFLYLPYLFLGHLAHWAGLSAPLIYHSTRILTGAFLLWAAYRFIAFVLPDPAWRWTAFLLTTVTGGFGWLVLLVTRSVAPGGMTPMDLWPLEFYTFSILLSAPHMMLGVALFLIVIQQIATYWETKSLSPLAGATLAALAQGFMLPFLPPIYGAALGLSWLWERRWRGGNLITAGAVIWAVLLPLPLVLYYWLQLQRHPVWVSIVTQDSAPSPAPWHFVIGYGLAGLLAIPGCRWTWQSGPRGRLVIFVVVISLVFAYIPMTFQRRLTTGAHVPLCILAAVGLHTWLIPLWQKERSTSPIRQPGHEGAIHLVIVALSALSTIYLLASMLLICFLRAPGFFLPPDTFAGLRWLARETPRDAAILSAFNTGTLIPAETGRRAFWGHVIETPFVAQKEAVAKHFFTGTTSHAERQRLLDQYHLTYFFYGPTEQGLGDFEPDLAPYLQPVFRQGNVTIYEVIN